MCELMAGLMHSWLDEWLDGRLGYMDDWLNGWLVEWVAGRVVTESTPPPLPETSLSLEEWSYRYPICLYIVYILYVL